MKLYHMEVLEELPLERNFSLKPPIENLVSSHNNPEDGLSLAK